MDSGRENWTRLIISNEIESVIKLSQQTQVQDITEFSQGNSSKYLKKNLNLFILNCSKNLKIEEEINTSTLHSRKPSLP